MSNYGESSFFLGIRFIERSRGLLGLSPKIILHQVLKRLYMHNCSPCEPTIFKGDKFSKSQNPKSETIRESKKHIPYAYVVGSLMYAGLHETKYSLCNYYNREISS